MPWHPGFYLVQSNGEATNGLRGYELYLNSGYDHRSADRCQGS